MASITRKPTSPFWIACFTDHTGRQRQMSTKEKDRTSALKRAIEFEEAYRGRIGEAQTRKILLAMHHEVHRERLNVESIRDYLTGWLSRKERETKKGTHVRYVSSVQKFVRHLGPRANQELTFVTSRDVLAFRDHTASTLTNSSANTDLKVLRIAFGQAWKDGLLPVNPAAQVDVLKVREQQETSRRPFTLEEIRSVLSCATGEWIGMILVGLYTGQRLGDIARLRWRQIDLEQGEIGFRTIKTGRVVRVPIVDPLGRYLRSLPRPASFDDAVFTGIFELVAKAGGDTRRLSNQFYDVMVRAGVAKKRSKANTGRGHSARRNTSPLSFHSLRHSATSLMKNSGVSDAVVMDIIGHDSPVISAMYTHIDLETKRAALQKVPDVSM